MDKSNKLYDKSYYKQSEAGFIGTERSDHARILKLVEFRPNDRVLDIGCGYGVLLSKIPCSQKSGIESNKYVVNECRKKGLDVNLNVDVESGLDYGNEVFDYIVMNEVIEHFRQPESVLREIHRILKQGGKVIITTPVKSILNQNLESTHCSEFSLNDLKLQLKRAGYEIQIHEVNGLSPYTFIMNRTVYKIARVIRKKNTNEKSSSVRAVDKIQSLYGKNPLAMVLSKFRRFLKFAGTQQLVIAKKI